MAQGAASQLLAADRQALVPGFFPNMAVVEVGRVRIDLQHADRGAGFESGGASGWPGTDWTKGQENMAGRTWYWRWQGVETNDDSFRALDVEVRTEEAAANARATLRTYVSR